ncbi:hypothetical protein EV426DRAFT_700547 [Tirmania nivea]|nr:hypothetical protein EV426DRAFT_700547 [Tirmania nivea]
MVKGHKTVMWVKGHSGVEGNERADRKAKEVAWVGRRMLRPDVITPAGIRQAFPMGRPSKQTKWNREALRGLTYMVTDRGPQRWWLHKVGRADDSSCGLCGEGVAQNAAHLLSCPGVADGKGREWEQIWEDPEWCEKLAEAVGGDWGSDNGVVVADFWGVSGHRDMMIDYQDAGGYSHDLGIHDLLRIYAIDWLRLKIDDWLRLEIDNWLEFIDEIDKSKNRQEKEKEKKKEKRRKGIDYMMVDS